MPLAAAVKVTLAPAFTVWLTGWVVIAGATTEELTVRVAAALRRVPAALERSTV